MNEDRPDRKRSLLAALKQSAGANDEATIVQQIGLLYGFVEECLAANYDPIKGSIRISDNEIRNAKPFEGWHPEFLKWETHPKPPGQRITHHDHDYDREHHAYHFRCIAADLLREGKWIGGPVQLFKPCPICNALYVADGNHRLRAAQFLVPTGYIAKFRIPFVNCPRDGHLDRCGHLPK